MSPKPMTGMLLEEGLVMYIDVGAVTVCRRRFEFGARVIQLLFTFPAGCSKGVPIQVRNRWRFER
jgi:hypothetical protein